ncbi:MAG TPA: hypothetical protein VFL82_06880 [Thermomicrobiales bacterium]|nr:hypothetical protein [Thermomicrobiales bacterium]
MPTKTVAAKLLIKPNTTVWLSHPDRIGLIAPLPDSVQTVANPAQATTALYFADDRDSIRSLLDAHQEQLAKSGVVWVAYPKANRVDVNRDSLWPILAGYGLRPISQVAVDEVWSALRFRPLKPGEEGFTGGRAGRVSP